MKSWPFISLIILLSYLTFSWIYYIEELIVVDEFSGYKSALVDLLLHLLKSFTPRFQVMISLQIFLVNIALVYTTGDCFINSRREVLSIHVMNKDYFCSFLGTVVFAFHPYRSLLMMTHNGILYDLGLSIILLAILIYMNMLKAANTFDLSTRGIMVCVLLILASHILPSSAAIIPAIIGFIHLHSTYFHANYWSATSSLQHVILQFSVLAIPLLLQLYWMVAGIGISEAIYSDAGHAVMATIQLYTTTEVRMKCLSRLITIITFTIFPSVHIINSTLQNISLIHSCENLSLPNEIGSLLYSIPEILQYIPTIILDSVSWLIIVSIFLSNIYVVLSGNKELSGIVLTFTVLILCCLPSSRSTLVNNKTEIATATCFFSSALSVIVSVCIFDISRAFPPKNNLARKEIVNDTPLTQKKYLPFLYATVTVILLLLCVCLSLQSMLFFSKLLHKPSR